MWLTFVCARYADIHVASAYFSDLHGEAIEKSKAFAKGTSDAERQQNASRGETARESTAEGDA